jgi:hypothetical protein
LIQIEYADYERHQEIVKSVASKILGTRVGKRGYSYRTVVEIVGDETRTDRSGANAHQLRTPPFQVVDG